jgi:hypothetical protein
MRLSLRTLEAPDVDRRRSAVASAYLRELLLHDRDYMIRWQRRNLGDYSSSLNKAAVSRFVFEWLEANGESHHAKDARHLEPRLGRALNGERFTAETMEWFIGAFEMSRVHEERLFGLLNGSETNGDGVPPIVIGATPIRGERTRQRRYDVLAVLERHQLDERGVPQRHTTFQVLRANQEGLSSYPYVFDTAEAEVTALRGGKMGAPKDYGRDDLTQVDFIFPRELGLGELVSFEYETRFMYKDRPEPRFVRRCERKVRLLDIGVQFHPNAAPSAAWWVSGDLHDENDRVRLPTETDDALSVHCLLELVTQSYVGFEWCFDDTER